MKSGVLHTIAASPHSEPFAGCMRVAQPDDAILLMGDAVYALTAYVEPLDVAQAAGILVFALERDCEARGVSAAPNAVVDMAGFVDLTEEYVRHLAWY